MLLTEEYYVSGSARRQRELDMTLKTKKGTLAKGI